MALLPNTARLLKYAPRGPSPTMTNADPSRGTNSDRPIANFRSEGAGDIPAVGELFRLGYERAIAKQKA